MEPRRGPMRVISAPYATTQSDLQWNSHSCDSGSKEHQYRGGKTRKSPSYHSESLQLIKMIYYHETQKQKFPM